MQTNDIPIETRKKNEDMGKLVDTNRYQRLVGKLIYLSHTELDIAFAVSLVIQYMHSSYEAHLEVVYEILRYLKEARGRGLTFLKNETKDIRVFIDGN